MYTFVSFLGAFATNHLISKRCSWPHPTIGPFHPDPRDPLTFRGCDAGALMERSNRRVHWLHLKKWHGWPSKHRGILPPKWRVKIMENPIKTQLMETPTFPASFADNRVLNQIEGEACKVSALRKVIFHVRHGLSSHVFHGMAVSLWRRK